MSKRVINIVIILILVMSLTSCSLNETKTSSSEINNDDISIEKAYEKSGISKVTKETEEVDTEADTEADTEEAITEDTEETKEQAEIPALSIISNELNQLTFSGYGHYVKTFNAKFQLNNQTNEPLDFKIRIPNNGEDIPLEKNVFAFKTISEDEIMYHLNPLEQKEFNITHVNSTVIGYLGEYSVGGIGGMVYEIQVGINNKWYQYSLNEEDNGVLIKEVIDITEMELLRNYDQQIQDLGEFKNSYEYKVEEFNQIISDLQKENKELPEYTIFKYPEASGMKYYDGTKPVKIYPSNSVNDLYSQLDSGGDVYCRAVVDCEGTNWGMIQFNGNRGLVTGFVEYSTLSPAEPLEELDTVEALGGFKLGDRIEKYIGILNRDYIMLYENGPIYIFPDEVEGARGGHERVFDGITSIDVFPGDQLSTWLVRTDSPMYPLNCGYKVGDNAKEVLEYFEDNYTVSDDHYWGEVVFDLTEDESISFRLGEGENLENQVIESIWIHR